MMSEIKKELYKYLNNDLDLMCNDAYIVTKDGSHIDFIDFNDIISQIKKHIENFDHIYTILAYQPYKESFKDTEKVYIDTKKKIKTLNNLNLQYWDIYYDLDEMTNDDNTGWQFLCSQVISLKNPQILKKNDKMNKKLNKEALKEIIELFNEVKKVTKLMNEWDIYITSDPWTATSFSDKEDILSWEEKDFKELELYGSGDKFYIGGNIVTGRQHEYNNEWIIAPKELAEVQGKVFEKYLKSIIKKQSLKHFKLEFEDPYGLIDNCGWEHFMCIKTTVKESGLETINKK